MHQTPVRALHEAHCGTAYLALVCLVPADSLVDFALDMRVTKGYLAPQA